METRPVHDLAKLILPVLILLGLGAWQADYALIYPLKATLAGLAGLFLALGGFLLRNNVLKGKFGPETHDQWRTGSRLILTGLAFYSLHPVVIAITMIAGFLYRFPRPPRLDSGKVTSYEAPAWIVSASIFFLLDIIREYTVWKEIRLNTLPLILFCTVVTVSILVLLNARSSKTLRK